VWRFGIRDTGIGIEPQQATNILVPVNRLKKDTDYASRKQELIAFALMISFLVISGLLWPSSVINIGKTPAGSKLKKADCWPSQNPALCRCGRKRRRVLPKEADLTEISLAENVQHETMHPADEFEAFRSLVDNGHSTADLAARFGISELTVQRRLALARVSPVLIQKYREEEMALELLQAFTISDDHQAQEQVWSQLQRWKRQPHTVRHMLAQDDLPLQKLQACGADTGDK
jgi:hypothetical protein